jgi:DNA-binding MarR family transcriptional regulator
MNTSTHSEENRKQDRSVFRLLIVLRDLDADMTMNQAVCFLWVLLNEGHTQVELRQELDMASSTASRSLTALSKVNRLGKPGLGLIEWVENPEDRRAKLLFLSDRGRNVVTKMRTALL